MSETEKGGGSEAEREREEKRKELGETGEEEKL